ncbi:MAG TPA: bifunctional 5,10-methylenetetrahydrofolate dehydrogenase/5,10-methenyltetrahydrofolate cyclohydrolase [Candidatus Saccharimonadales bacterium]|nr:bifunctional 5,10-methylenetetrahydrofolate dehydrogenase/5,10-methenyltetrahydrofolate cyclohydrolase [Candidatus Saccharimonadales bacterium]
MTGTGEQARLLDGRKAAAQIRREVAEGVANFVNRGLAPPALDVVLVGDHPASAVYVRSKEKACREAGLRARIHRLPAETSEGDLLRLVRDLGDDRDVDGILVQMPLPPGIRSRVVIEAVDPSKDVDGFHPLNVGKLWTGRDGFVPCTPLGIVALLEMSGVPIEGARAVVIGRSDIVGRPMAALLMHRNATVTICHSRTRDLASVAARADILIAAIGKPAFVTAEFIKPGATVIDVGIGQVRDVEEAARLFDGDPARLEQVKSRGYTLVGDVHPAEASRRAGALTPVPGGVGPLTVALLLKNTLRAALSLRGRS